MLLFFILNRFMMIAIHSNEFSLLFRTMSNCDEQMKDSQTTLDKKAIAAILILSVHHRLSLFLSLFLSVCVSSQRLSVSNVIRVKVISLGKTFSYCSR